MYIGKIGQPADVIEFSYIKGELEEKQAKLN